VKREAAHHTTSPFFELERYLLRSIARMLKGSVFVGFSFNISSYGTNAWMDPCALDILVNFSGGAARQFKKVSKVKSFSHCLIVQRKKAKLLGSTRNFS
jgi:hypothetical protein